MSVSHGGLMQKFIFILITIILGTSSALNAVILRFNHTSGRKYRVKNIIRQDIYLNGRFNSSREAMNKATLSILSATNGWGNFEGKYYYYSKNLNYNESYHLMNVYQTFFREGPQGQMDISDRYLMPTLRDVPRFPTNDVKPGDTWTFKGEEIHEGIIKQANWFKFDVNVDYQLDKIITNNGKRLAHILIDYHVMYYPKIHPELFSITGYTHNNFYWNIDKGAPDSYSDQFSFLVTLKNGETVLYRGRSQAIVEEIRDITNTEKSNMIVTRSNKMSNDKGTSVKSVADGVIVNLGSILFDINKATLKRNALDTLDKVARTLRKYPDLDIEVSGHTDNTGKEPFNQILSENRAKSVSDYLVKKGISPTRISYIGYGARRPVASNDTIAGRALNRRVEIKIITKE